MIQKVKNLPAMQETRVQSLGRADPLEESMATLSSSLAGVIPGTESLVGSQRVRHDRVTNAFTFHCKRVPTSCDLV